MGIVIFYDIAENEDKNSSAVTASLIKLQLQHDTIYSVKTKILRTNLKLEKLCQNTQKLNVMQCFLFVERLKLNYIHQDKVHQYSYLCYH